MKKIISLFQRNYDGDRQVRNEVVPGAEWVLAGEGVPTRKHDGTSCMILSSLLYKRYDAKNGKVPPAGFIPAQEPDPVTGHWPGWVLVTDSDKWHIEAARSQSHLPDGTYELVGPKINGNREQMDKHVLIVHGCIALPNIDRTFDSIKKFLQENMMEGIVWHHPDGRMVKIKRKDFGFTWGDK
jgi:hypothetical protein